MWNPALVERAARRAACQMAIVGAGLTFSPVADHALDTKQGRNQEQGAAVESPLLMGDMVAAMIRGYQGSALRAPDAVAATLKHWLGYQYPHSPDYTDSGASRRLPLEDCLPAFQAGFAADAAAVMYCFTTVVPAHASRYLHCLARSLGVKNLIFISDYNVAYVKGADFERLDETLSEALARAAHATHIFVALGERWDWSGESKARLMPKVPDAQVEFVQRLREATGVHIIVSITAGRPLKIPDVVLQCADAILWAPQLGTHAGTALANVLSGKKNFSGRLAHALLCHEAVTSGFSHREPRISRPSIPCNAQTFEYNSQGWGAYFQELGERGSLAEYHYGEGYSYTEFALSHRVLSGASLSIAGGTALIASALVENVGTVAGKETVQLYRHDTIAEAVPRRLELLAYKQVELAPGESVEVSFAITPDMLAQYGVDLDAGRRPRPDPYPVYLFIVRHAGEAEAALFSAEPKPQFVLTK